MELKSSAFEDGQPIPKKYTGDGKDVSPPLNWEEPPAGTTEFAILVQDLDSQRDEPFYHWIMFGIPGAVRSFPEAVPKDGRGNLLIARQGTNSFSYDNWGYRGPAPLDGSGVHRYQFTLYALSKRLSLFPGASGAEFVRGVRPIVLEQATLTGTFDR